MFKQISLLIWKVYESTRKLTHFSGRGQYPKPPPPNSKLQIEIQCVLCVSFKLNYAYNFKIRAAIATQISCPLTIYTKHSEYSNPVPPSAIIDQMLSVYCVVLVRAGTEYNTTNWFN